MRLPFFLPLIAAMLFFDCSKDETPTNASAGTDTLYAYIGTGYDSVLAQMLLNAGMNYAGTLYRYYFISDGSYLVSANVGMGYTKSPVEEGRFSVTDTSWRFTVLVNRRRDVAQGTMVPVDTLRPDYEAKPSGDTLTIENFLNIENKADQRNFNTVRLIRQP